MKHLVSALFLLCASFAWSQSTATGTITASGSSCPINTQASNCVVLPLPAFSSTVGISILGTYSATLQFEVSADFGASWVSATAIPQPVAAGVNSTTSTGTWQVNVAGMSHIRIRGSAYTSGTASISLAAASGIGPNSGLNSVNANNLSQAINNGAQIAEKGARWTVIAGPGSGSVATATKAAGGAGVRHVVDCISFSAEASVAPTATDLNIQVKDGSTIIWYYAVGIPASTGTLLSHSFCGLNLIGTANTAMSIGFSGGVTSVFEAADISGYDVQ